MNLLPYERSLQTLDKVNEQLEREKKEAQGQRDYEMALLGFRIGCIIGPLLSQKLVLERENGELADDIKRLEKSYTLAIATTTHAWETKKTRISERLGEAVRLIQRHQIRVAKIPCGALSIDPSPFQKLIDSLPEIEPSQVEKCPENTPNPPREAEDGNGLALVSLNPYVQEGSAVFAFLQEQGKEVQGLKQEVGVLQAENDVLLEQKRKISKFYDESIKKINEQKQNELDPKKIMVKARAILDSINWRFQGPFDRCTSGPCYPARDHTPSTARHWHNYDRANHITRLDKLHRQLTVLLDVLEDEIDPELQAKRD